MTTRKIALWLLIAFIIYLIVNDPDDAVMVTKSIEHLLGQLFEGGVRFIHSFRS